VPAVNWLQLAGVVALVLSFKSSTNLAAAYGIAVTGTMLVTTVLVFVLARARLEVGLGAVDSGCSAASSWSTPRCSRPTW
jgi:K+ transporter